ncbi:hypothetical protein FQA39_LY19144 [Lamprigera yunnana]|nr:hypothetical protein FQA39_LY19144 [Lamprigera yunnana]
MKDEDMPKELKEHIKLIEETFEYDFIPVSVLKNNIKETSRMQQVKTRLAMIDEFDKNIAIAPKWEMGGILTNSAPIIAQNQEKQNLKFMENLLNKGFVSLKPIEMDGQIYNLTTRDLIMQEIKEDLGMPKFNDVKSAQQSTAEIQLIQFLSTPHLEREKILMKEFVKDLIIKFLLVLSECVFDEKKEFTLTTDEIKALEVDVEFTLTTERKHNFYFKRNGIKQVKT